MMAIVFHNFFSVLLVGKKLNNIIKEINVNLISNTKVSTHARHHHQFPTMKSCFQFIFFQLCQMKLLGEISETKDLMFTFFMKQSQMFN
jgi:hypothetical protein